MRPTFSFYTAADFTRVHQFLRRAMTNGYLTYDAVNFQFSQGLHVEFIGNGLQGGFERTCGIWEDEAGVAALVMTEGATLWGDVFFTFRCARDKTPELMHRMCDFAERFSSKISDDRKSNSYRLCVAEDDFTLSGFLSQRGYQRTEESRRIMIKTYPDVPEEAALPEGFTIHDARTIPPFYYALAHNHSFRYNQDNDGCERGFAKLRTMPDYRPELDLILLDPDGKPAGLANFWVHERSDTAVLEPLGTVWWYRRMGLGQALVMEGINRTRAFGCTQIMGGDQPFYWQMGFENQKTHYYWSWSS